MHLRKKMRLIAGVVIAAMLVGVPTVYGQPTSTHPMAQNVVIPILMYHEVKPYHVGKDVITPYELESDLKYLKENNYTTLTMQDLIDYTKWKRDLPAKPVVLSFDDGYLNNYLYVYPLLKKYNTKIVLSIIGKDTDDFTRTPNKNPDFSHVNWDQVNELVKSGLVEIQNHTYNMHHITPKRRGCNRSYGEALEHYDQALTEDINKLQQELTEKTGYTPTTFTYPFGWVSKESYPIIKRLGFQASLTCRFGVNIIKRDPDTLFGLRRICRPHGVSAKKSLQNAMKTLKFRKYSYSPAGRWIS